MNSAGRELRRILHDELLRHPSITFAFWRRKRHPAVTIRGPGGKRTITFGGTPKNRHTTENTLMRLRHALRIVEGEAA